MKTDYTNLNISYKTSNIKLPIDNLNLYLNKKF